MSLLDTLPNEIYRMINGYNNPIYEYVNNCRNLEERDKLYKNLQEFRSSMWYESVYSFNDHDDDSETAKTQLKMYESITILQQQMCTTLEKIAKFYRDNPKLKRPYFRKDLTKYQYKTHNTHKYTLDNIIDIEKKLDFKRIKICKDNLYVEYGGIIVFLNKSTDKGLHSNILLNGIYIENNVDRDEMIRILMGI
jgi:hypothetical protein